MSGHDEIANRFARSNAEQTAGLMTDGEKIQLIAGKDFWRTADIPRLGIPSVKVSHPESGAMLISLSLQMVRMVCVALRISNPWLQLVFHGTSAITDPFPYMQRHWPSRDLGQGSDSRDWRPVEPRIES